MSYIDTFDHQYVGSFAGLPIYYPRVQVQGDGVADFACGPDNLVLGGGCGEHPGLIFHHLDCLAMHFVVHAVGEDDEEALTVTEEFGDFQIWAYLDVSFAELFEFAGWSVEDYHDFYERCKSVALARPFGAYDDLCFEEWLAISFGELIWFSFSDLIENLSPIREKFPNLQSIANNVTIPPPGYPERYGRRQNEHGVVWGNHYFTQTIQNLLQNKPCEKTGGNSSN